ncbi:mitochondrial import receptor subunit TOM70 [Cephus cinctus]|uniref:Mitochondrial import receptor subunit TOM70 n=1 Tax=Cephus cinctus TaxID=211228 RepID=A0AAJ7FNZ3_CEPCN|nr:mitochondrial import receptor subunit TOM70 [Cephus cinctus]
MTASSAAGSIASSSPLPKWQLALAVGAPVALGLGYMYYKNSTKSASKPDRGKAKGNIKENGTSADKQISIDGEISPKGQPLTEPANETQLEKAQRYKNEGNNFFKAGKYDEAISWYNKAIETCPTENPIDLATFYHNRAAAYEHLKKYSAVKADCTKALEFNPRYIKALQRRARAMEHSKELELVLEDVTAACILERFNNQSTLMMADRVLKELGRQHALEHMAKKKPVMPSKHFIKTYFSSFRKDPILATDDEQSTDNITSDFESVRKALKEESYDDVIPLCTEEINALESDSSLRKMKILLLRATFYLLLGQHEEAIADLETIINSDSASKEVKANALIKRASMYMQLENPTKCFADFDLAIEIDPDCSDIYHHRGQVNLLLEKVEEAKADFQKAVDLNPTFAVAFVQKCYTDYRYGHMKKDVYLMEQAMQGFQDAFDKFPDCSECYTLYAQMLSDVQEYAKADSYFAKAIEKDPNNATIHVHRGLLQLQWNGNIDKAMEYIKKALEMDDKCEFGYETLGTIEVQRGNMKEAIELFDKALELGRTAIELTHIFSLKDAAQTQLTVTERLGMDLSWLGMS